MAKGRHMKGKGDKKNSKYINSNYIEPTYNQQSYDTMPEIGVIKNQSDRKTRKTKSNKQGFLQGVLTLMFSQVLIKLLGMIYTLYLTNREGFGDEGNGIVSSSYQIYAMLLTISSIGVPNAISKLVSERVAVGDHKGAYRIFKIAFATFARVLQLIQF